MTHDGPTAPRPVLRVDYGSLAALPPLAERWAYRALVVRLPGYRRRLDLRGRCWERLLDVFLFAAADAAAAAAALADPERAAFVADRPACGDTTVALLAEEGDHQRGVLAVLLCPAGQPVAAGEGWRRERLVRNDYTEAQVKLTGRMG